MRDEDAQSAVIAAQQALEDGGCGARKPRDRRFPVLEQKDNHEHETI